MTSCSTPKTGPADAGPYAAVRADNGQCAIPVTFDDHEADNLVGSGVLMPDGRVFSGDGTLADEAAWRVEMADCATPARGCP
jgi:hypothetical protein